ncbi:MAG: hypothetical protein PWQ84_245 [Thermotogaceae bacterium]|nr:hypothetical protein [Thermotogaceae bacterium]
MEVKVIQKNQISTLLALINEVFDDYPIPVNWTEREFEMDMIENRISLEDSFFLFKDSIPVGFIVIAKNNDRARIDSMGVKNDFRGTGCAELLLQHTLENLKWKKIESVMLEVIESDKRAVRFYEKQGFSHERKLFSLLLDLNDFSPEVYRYKNSNTHIIHELSLQANNIFHRHLNWQRMPSALGNSGDRYYKEVIYDKSDKGHPIGYLVWGENTDNAYIIDTYTVNPDYDLKQIIQDVKRFLRTKTNKTKCLITNVPENDDLFENLVGCNAEILFKQIEMELNLR